MHTIYNLPDVCWDVLNNIMSSHYLCYHQIYASDPLNSTKYQLVMEDMLEFDEGGENHDEWCTWLEYKYHIDHQQQGNIMEEQLLIEGAADVQLSCM
jgi:hypothetical protein